jgi:hypothetical protein
MSAWLNQWVLTPAFLPAWLQAGAAIVALCISAHEINRNLFSVSASKPSVEEYGYECKRSHRDQGRHVFWFRPKRGDANDKQSSKHKLGKIRELTQKFVDQHY